ncbi:hypothetical protein DIPPA_34552 [Diplonema papillatum]|nr:hypothetical protein DIPPA_34552 [Diplonema papillatum]
MQQQRRKGGGGRGGGGYQGNPQQQGSAAAGEFEPSHRTGGLVMPDEGSGKPGSRNQRRRPQPQQQQLQQQQLQQLQQLQQQQLQQQQQPQQQPPPLLQQEQLQQLQLHQQELIQQLQLQLQQQQQQQPQQQQQQLQQQQPHQQQLQQPQQQQQQQQPQQQQQQPQWIFTDNSNAFRHEIIGGTQQVDANAFSNNTIPPRHGSFGGGAAQANNAFNDNGIPPRHGSFGGGARPVDNTFSDNSIPPRFGSFGGGAAQANNAFSDNGIPPRHGSFGGVAQQVDAFSDSSIPPRHGSFGGVARQVDAFSDSSIPPRHGSFGGVAQQVDAFSDSSIPPRHGSFGGGAVQANNAFNDNGVPPRHNSYGGGARQVDNAFSDSGIPPRHAAFSDGGIPLRHGSFGGGAQQVDNAFTDTGIPPRHGSFGKGPQSLNGSLNVAVPSFPRAPSPSPYDDPAYNNSPGRSGRSSGFQGGGNLPQHVNNFFTAPASPHQSGKGGGRVGLERQASNNTINRNSSASSCASGSMASLSGSRGSSQCKAQRGASFTSETESTNTTNTTQSTLPANVTQVPPCNHNEWTCSDRRKTFVTLKCLACDVKWKTVLGEFSKCPDFHAESRYCPRGAECKHPHVYARSRINEAPSRKKALEEKSAGSQQTSDAGDELPVVSVEGTAAESDGGGGGGGGEDAAASGVARVASACLSSAEKEKMQHFATRKPASSPAYTGAQPMPGVHPDSMTNVFEQRSKTAVELWHATRMDDDRADEQPAEDGQLAGPGLYPQRAATLTADGIRGRMDDDSGGLPRNLEPTKSDEHLSHLFTQRAVTLTADMIRNGHKSEDDPTPDVFPRTLTAIDFPRQTTLTHIASAVKKQLRADDPLKRASSVPSPAAHTPLASGVSLFTPEPLDDDVAAPTKQLSALFTAHGVDRIDTAPTARLATNLSGVLLDPHGNSLPCIRTAISDIHREAARRRSIELVNSLAAVAGRASNSNEAGKSNDENGADASNGCDDDAPVGASANDDMLKPIPKTTRDNLMVLEGINIETSFVESEPAASIRDRPW